MAISPNRLRPWADLVFHVMAHVRPRGPSAASVFDPVYVAFAEKALGPASSRHLEEDARILGRIIATHESLVAVQMLAWLFPTLPAALSCAPFELGQLPPAASADPSLLPVLARHAQAAEILWASALLESEHHAALPQVECDEDGVGRALAAIEVCAPRLRSCTVAFVRALRLRGRVFRGEIWVGTPCGSLALDADHVAWQASHEASVLEVTEAANAVGVSLAHPRLEHAAVVLLASRAADCGMSAQHARWLTHLESGAPCPEQRSLGPEEATVVERILSQA